MDFKLTKKLGASFFGLYRSMFYWTGIDFAEHREYFPWDPIKNIDWKASSRTNKIYSKRFEENRDLKVLFLIKIWNSMNFSIFERTKKEVLEEIFYSLSVSASVSGDSIWALLYGDNSKIFVDYKKWNWNIFRILEAINQEIPNPDHFPLTPHPNPLPLGEGKGERNVDKNVFEYLQRQNLRNNLVFVLTDETDLIDDKNLKLLSFSNQIIFFNIFDYFENNLADFGVDLSLNNWNNFLNISLNDKQKIEKFRKIRQKNIENLENFLRKNKIFYKNFDTKKDVFKELYLFFK